MFTIILTYLAILLGLLLTGGALIWVLQQRRSPQSALAWIGFIVAMPYLGVPAFFTLGTRKRGARYAMIDFEPGGAVAPVHPVDAQLRRLGLPPADTGHSFVLETTSEAARASLDSLVAGATQSLDIVLYRLDKDGHGEAFTRALTDAVRRGVRVRMILDRFGTLSRPYRALHDFEAAGGQLQLFARMSRFGWMPRVNLRNHRKMVIVDGQTVWSGGRNVGETYLAPQGDPKTWHDLSFVLKGPLVRRFCEVFEADWAKNAGRGAPEPCPAAPGKAGEVAAQVLPSGPDLPHDGLHDGLVHLIHTAQRRIWVVTPYLLPTDQLQHALLTAARLGRDVRLLVPAVSNQKLADFARGDYLRDLEEAGCTILRYTGGMVHAKAVLIDDVAVLGSANLDVRSMLLNFEAAVAVYDRAVVGEVEAWFAGLEAGCVSGTRPASLPRRLAEGAFRLGAPVL